MFQREHMSPFKYLKRNIKFLLNLLWKLACQKRSLLSHHQMYRHLWLNLRQPPERWISSKDINFIHFRNGQLYAATQWIILQGMIDIGLKTVCFKVLVKTFGS